MKIQNPENKKKLIQRLKRIEGQVRGVQGMLEDERDCKDIMQQLNAISSAVRSTSREFFRDYAAICMQEANTSKRTSTDNQKMIEDMMTLMEKTP